MHSKLIRSLLPFVLALILLPLSSAARIQEQGADFSALDKVALDELASTGTPGAAIAIVSGDRVVYTKGFGVSNVETGAPVTPEMLFRLGSTTKMFTAAGLVALVDQGKARLDEPVGKYVTGLPSRIA